MKILGIALVVLGIAALVLGGIGLNRQKTVFQVGEINASVTERQSLPIASVAGVLAVVGGVVLVAVARKQRT